MSGTRTSETEGPRPEGSENHSDPLSVALDIEREKLKLERERLDIERDRLEADREVFEVRMANAPDPEDISFGISALCGVAALCLLLGGIIGFSTGLDIGRGQSPEARKIQVSRKFVDMMISIRGYDRLPAREDEAPLWQRLRSEQVPISMIVLK